jgi:hypothetical protein
MWVQEESSIASAMLKKFHSGFGDPTLNHVCEHSSRSCGSF